LSFPPHLRHVSGSAWKTFAMILDWLGRDGRLVYGGQLARELAHAGAAARYLLRLFQAGRALRVPDGQLDAETRTVVTLGVCGSDDQHVIALARTSGARTLCSDDRALIGDFRNPILISRPRGKAYRRETHVRLLAHVLVRATARDD